MRHLFFAMALAGTALGGTAAVAAPAPAAAAAATKAHYVVAETDLGTLLDDPAAKAVLSKHIPTVVSNPNIEMGRAMTLVQMKAYAGDALTDETLAKIQADLDAAAPK